ncbi:dTDP-4-keto-6-deoxy-D-glucose epimerase [Enterococcus faecium]|nr:dTDP-4-keto-6-deoxy-D-glucose epimerase [Enterococcus faecium]
MKVTDTKLTDVKIVEMDVFGDHRGFFTESYSKAKFAEHGLKYDFVQDNHSLSAEAGVLRGLHFQKGEAAQTKLICSHWSSFRCSSGYPRTTYGQWDGFILSEHNHRQLLVPKGYAHGFVTLTPNVNFLYKCDNYYNAEADGASHLMIRFSD